MTPDNVQKILDHVDRLKLEKPGQWMARCPAHDDAKASLSIGIGREDRALVRCLAGCTTHAVLSAIGLKLADLFPADSGKPASKIVATYPYVDENGVLLFEVVRFQPKDFKQRAPDGKWSIVGIRRVLYRLPELLASTGTVYVVEGEKDAEAMRSIGLTATTCPGGAGKWDKVDDAALKGRDVVVIADNDAPGRKHAREVAKRLKARCVTVPNGKDAADYIASGGRDFSNLPDLVNDKSSVGTSLGQRDADTGRIILSPKRTLPTAEAFLREFYSHDDGPCLTTYAGVAYAWRNNRHEPIEPEYLNNQLYPWLHGALRFTKTDGLIDFEANPTTVSQARQSILDHAYIASDMTSPCWIKPRSTDLPAHEILPCRSSSLHLPSGGFIAPTPRLFVTSSLDFDYDPAAPVARQWEQFLLDVFEGDLESILLLQQWFGYCLTTETRQQKMLLMIGPKRSGKGTIARVLRRLIGDGNVVGPTTTSLAGAFGLQPLIGKSLAIVSDARFSGEGVMNVVERLLCISGEDTLTIDRKFLGSVTMKLPTRFAFLTNEPPRLSDSSGALAGRFLVLKFPRSWYGHEDKDLTDKLLLELPGILKWAIEGWHMLRENGHFTMPPASVELVEEMEDTFSPVGAFVRERCDTGTDCRVWVSELFEAWENWCKDQGRTRPGTVQSFARDIRSSVVGLKTHKDIYRFYTGIKLKGAL